jgi:hypothetical protein
MSQRIPRSIRLIAELGQSAFQKRFDETGKSVVLLFLVDFFNDMFADILGLRFHAALLRL